MSLPTTGMVYSELTEHLRKAQENCATLAHLVRDDDKLQAQGWLAVSELMKLTLHNIVKLATKGRLN